MGDYAIFDVAFLPEARQRVIVVNTRFIHEDLFAKLAQFIRRGSRI